MAELGRPFWREPLLHFLLAGAVIFAVNAWRGPERSPGSDKIIVTVDQVERLAILWTKTWGRAPTESELQGLVRDRIKEEVYYREALKLGLDVNDTVIRRRLRQKMEFFVLTDLEAQAPDEAVLREWFAENTERYTSGPSYSFEQVYFERNDAARIIATQESLIAGVDARTLGDAISLPASMTKANRVGIERSFGGQFHAALAGLPVGAWSDPVTSGYGQHLVLVTAVTPSLTPSFETVRAQVQRDWMAEQKIRVEREAYEKLRAHYKIQIESPDE